MTTTWQEQKLCWICRAPFLNNAHIDSKQTESVQDFNNTTELIVFKCCRCTGHLDCYTERYCYDYNADRYCEKCGLEIIKQLDELDQIELENAPDLTHRSQTYYTDSDGKTVLIDYNDANNYPQKTSISEISPGTPEYCGNCHVFIPAPPNEALLQYVRMEAETDVAMYGSLRETTALWVRFYSVEL